MALNDLTHTISIIILNWNGIDDTIECIAALETQPYQDFIIWLVDNGSETSEVEQLKKAYENHPKVRLVLNDRNLGFTEGNNRILEEILGTRREAEAKENPILSPQPSVLSPQSSVGSLPELHSKAGPKSAALSPKSSPQSSVRNPQSEIHSPQSEILANSQKPEARSQQYVALLNNDAVPSPQWLDQLVQTAQSENADMVSSKMINYFDRDKMDNAGHVLLNTLEVLPLGHDAPVDNYNSVVENTGACGGAALYSIAMLKDAGIFDERFTNGYEDVELGLRATLCGYKSIYAPGAIVYHKGSRSINKIRDFDYTLGIQRHIYYITGKLFPWSVILLCLPFILFRFIAAFLINLFTFRWKYLRIQCLALYHLLLTDRKAIRAARKKFFHEHRVLHTLQILRTMHFFWKYDWARFRKYILKGEKMVFERF